MADGGLWRATSARSKAGRQASAFGGYGRRVHYRRRQTDARNHQLPGPETIEVLGLRWSWAVSAGAGCQCQGKLPGTMARMGALGVRSGRAAPDCRRGASGCQADRVPPRCNTMNAVWIIIIVIGREWIAHGGAILARERYGLNGACTIHTGHNTAYHYYENTRTHRKTRHGDSTPNAKHITARSCHRTQADVSVWFLASGSPAVFGARLGYTLEEGLNTNPLESSADSLGDPGYEATDLAPGRRQASSAPARSQQPGPSSCTLAPCFPNAKRVARRASPSPPITGRCI